jgi:hypothetical protein
VYILSFIAILILCHLTPLHDYYSTPDFHLACSKKIANCIRLVGVN